MLPPTIPTVSDTVRAYTRRFFLGDSAGWLTAPLTMVVYISAVLFAVPVGTMERAMPLTIGVLVSVAAIDGVHREYRFGGPPGLILVAALTTGVNMCLAVVTVFAIRRAVGDPPHLVFFGGVVALVTFAILVAYFGGFWTRAEAAIEAEVRAERARRGIDAVASGITRPDRGEFWAYVFTLALGGFGLLITAISWIGYPNWLNVALGLGISGTLAVLGLVGIVRARRASRR